MNKHNFSLPLWPVSDRAASHIVCFAINKFTQPMETTMNSNINKLLRAASLTIGTTLIIGTTVACGSTPTEAATEPAQAAPIQQPN
jgi:hypothetical protein